MTRHEVNAMGKTLCKEPLRPQVGTECPTCGYKVPQKSTGRVRRHRAGKKGAK